MNRNPPPATDTDIKHVERLALAIVTIISAIIGVGLGAVIFPFATEKQSVWHQLILIPVYIVLEVVIEIIVKTLGFYSRNTRIFVALALLVGFYSTWLFQKST